MKFGIYKKIKDRILSLKYQPGEMLKENILAEEFGISRTPIREVLLRLEWEGLVKIIPRGGAMVTSIEFSKVREVYEIRVFTDSCVANLAAERITTKQIEELNQIKKECETLLVNGKHEDLIKIDLRFRELLHRAAGNTTLKEYSDYFYNMIVRVWPQIFDKIGLDPYIKITIDEINDILKAFTNRDAKAAEKSRREFIILWGDLIAMSLSSTFNISKNPSSLNNPRLDEILNNLK